MKKIVLIVICVVIVIIISMYYLKNYDDELIDISQIKTDSNFENITYDKEELIENDTLGTLEIEKIGLKASVKEGSGASVLKRYIGHIEDTSIYDRKYWSCRT